MSEPTRTHPPDSNQATVTRGPEASSRDEAGELVAPLGYELLGEIGSGGMGVVYRAHDLDLGREVAIKILLPQYAPDSSTARRFVDEARITGRLQHPGIPAIYRVGMLSDGRPFLAMKLIGGRTLDELLRKRTSPAAEGGPFLTPFEQATHGMLDRLEAVLQQGRFLAVFEQVAQAVGYAHQQGVIHRDLKPSNVMVGDFGEVQVLDWGIARSGDRQSTVEAASNGEPAATVEYSPHADPRTPQSDLTQAGAILGTPAFMPPEQAIGAVDQIGKPSDVFGLGAILCVILTGKPPYVGVDAESNRQLAARAKLDDAFARLDDSGAEPGLITLAKRCLAPEPTERPRNAGEVAEAVAVLRADAERRARQAEMDRARAEVKSAEERKRRRVQYALALTVLGLLAVSGFTGWWVDKVRAQRKADDLTRANEARARQQTAENEVVAALNETQLLREEGWKQVDDPQRWGLTLAAAQSALRRADSRRIDLGTDTSNPVHARVRAAWSDLERDERDRQLLTELDRIADSNEIRLLFSFSFTSVTARQFASAFRTHGIDLLTVPTEEAVAWLKQHPHQARLITAIRNWQQSLPGWDVGSIADLHAMEAIAASAAVAGYAPILALTADPSRSLEKALRKSGPFARLTAILNAVTIDSFTRQWWDAVQRRDYTTLKTLFDRPELGRLTSRELSSLADGLTPMSNTHQLLGPFLKMVYARFPGEFWVNFRIALQGALRGQPARANSDEKDRRDLRFSHLTAALAIRPHSAIARAALGMEIMEQQKNIAEGLRWLHSAVEADPASPWPHLFLGIFAMELRQWPEAFQELKEAVRVDPDTAFFMTSSTMLFMIGRDPRDSNHPAESEIIRLIKDMIAVQPKHPGGYDLLGKFYRQFGDHRQALALFRKAEELSGPDYPGRSALVIVRKELESQALWEEKLPAVLRGELRLTGFELTELAGYCATFDKKFALATRFTAEAIRADPALLRHWPTAIRFVGWAIQAGLGQGADAASTPLAVREYDRRLALEWMRETTKRQGSAAGSMRYLIETMRDFALLRDPAVRATFPPDERAGWEKVWREVGLAKPGPAPPPRPKP